MKHKILTGILVLAIIGAIGSDGGDNANSSMDNQSKEVAQNTEVEAREDVATEEETKERDRLRKEYLKNFREAMRSNIEMMRIFDKEGKEVTPEKVREIQRKKGLRDD